MAPKNRHLIAAVAFLTGGLATPAAAQQFQDLNAMERRLVIALGADIGDPGGPTAPVDRRLRLQPCPQPVTIEPPVLGAATIRCQPLGWRIRIPLVRAANTTQSAAARTPAAPHVQAPAAQHAEAAAEIPMPTPAPVRATRAQPIIRRGEPVSLVVMASGFQVTRSAVADQDGAIGDTIRIRTERGQQPIVGQVMADGRILMPGFN